ncbi:hypothetical protein K2173_007375 [Erythroxylum novogranatense]|uniref:EF-hand domain-containing protein n=1 Tax=Erythroxylum novogranatense TaxID=1862640 RepID=A0AAV8T7E2_9ROSI|nr:hypothetical protein K2173_007375 [Erythroxylum novogranatense]
MPHNVPKASNLTHTEELKTTFKHHDADGDGKLSREELKKAFQKLDSRFPGWRASKALQHVDTNRDGSISFDKEMDALVKYVMEIMGVKKLNGGAQMSMVHFKKWLSAFDNNNDGKISQEELTEAFRITGMWFSGWKAQRAMKFVDSDGDSLIDIESEIEKLAEFVEKNLHVKIIKP